MAALAAEFEFSGNIAYHNDVVRIPFTLTADARDVRVWTDGFLNGLNFDPITAVWSLPAGTLIGENDDNDTIAPGQTYFDSGVVFDSLAAGSYLFTIATFNNFARSPSLADGFRFDAEAPIAIADWCQPASDDCNNQKGTFWRVHLAGVDQATAPIPEPATVTLLALGIGATAAAARRRRRG